eukprot:1158298-Pelagomonas_calceolata.AAC.6
MPEEHSSPLCHTRSSHVPASPCSTPCARAQHRIACLRSTAHLCVTLEAATCLPHHVPSHVLVHSTGLRA